MAEFILNDWTEILDPAPWAARCLHRCVSVGEYIYMCGGYTKTPAIVNLNDVWRSPDGITWEQLVEHANWSARSAHGFIYYNGKFYVMGGINQAGIFLHDVWSSTNCINWIQETAAAAWSGRHEFGLCEHNNKMLLSGGWNGAHLSGVYSSSNGSVWINEGLMGDGIREHVQMSFLALLWVFGGDSFTWGAFSRRIRSSPTGAVWTDRGNAAWPGRREHQGVINLDKDRIAIVGGYNGISLNDVWQTTNGLNWTQIVQINPYTARSDFSLVNHLGRCYIIGGIDAFGGNVLGDVWAGDIELYARFSGSPTTIYLGDTVQFINTSAGNPFFCMWNFGYDAAYAMTSGNDGVSHRFAQVGVFTITLVIGNIAGELSTLTRTGYITVLPLSIDFSGTPRSGPAALNVNFKVEMVEP